MTLEHAETVDAHMLQHVSQSLPLYFDGVQSAVHFPIVKWPHIHWPEHKGDGSLYYKSQRWICNNKVLASRTRKWDH